MLLNDFESWNFYTKIHMNESYNLNQFFYQSNAEDFGFNQLILNLNWIYGITLIKLQIPIILFSKFNLNFNR